MTYLVSTEATALTARVSEALVLGARGLAASEAPGNRIVMLESGLDYV